METKNTWVVIPGYNESKYLDEVLKDTKKYLGNIIYVDDGSSDNSVDIAKKNEVIVLEHSSNMGKGIALKTGCDYAISHNAVNIIVMDSDGQHQAKEIPKFLDELKNNDIVFSYRVIDKNMPFLYKFGNNILDFFVKLFFKAKIKDTQCGYRAFTSSAYKKIRWNSKGYSIETEMIARAVKNNLKFSQIPIKTIYNEKYKGTNVLDGFKILFDIIKWKVKL